MEERGFGAAVRVEMSVVSGYIQRRQLDRIISTYERVIIPYTAV